MWVQMLKKIQPKTPAPYTHLAVTEAWRNTTQEQRNDLGFNKLKYK